MRATQIGLKQNRAAKTFSICFRRTEARRARFPPAMDVIGFYGLITSGADYKRSSLDFFKINNAQAFGLHRE
jgi:hypothetical protein